GLLNRLGVGAHVNCVDLDIRRSDGRKLRNRQTGESDGADDHREDCDDHGHNGAVNEEFGHGSYLTWNAFGSTIMPVRTFCSPSTMTRSPAFTPSRTIHWFPTVTPSVAARIVTLLELSTTASW